MNSIKRTVGLLTALMVWYLSVLVPVLAAGDVQYVYDGLNRLVRVVNENDQVATYNYDAVGNILSIDRTTLAQLPPPSLTSITPSDLEQGTTVTVTLNGNSLLGGALSINNPDIALSNIAITNTQVKATLTIGANAALGPAQLTVTTLKGSASLSVFVFERDLPIRLTLNPNPVVSGGRLLAEILVTNQTASPLAAVQVILRVPAGLSFSYFNDAEPDSSACSANVCDLGEEPTWNLGTLAAGASATIQVNATVAAGLADGTLITVPVEVRSTSFSQAVQAERTVTVNNNPALAAKLSASADPVAPGDSLGFSVDLGNAGTAAVTGIDYRLLLPRHVTFVNANNGGVYDAASRTVNWPVGSLAAGAHVLRTATVTVDTATPAGSILTAHGELRHDGGAELDASQAQAVAVLAAVPMQLQLTASPDPVSAGGRLLTDIVVTNTTASPLAAVRVVLRVPGGLSFSYFNDAEPDSSACSANVCDLGEEPTWNLGTLAAGASATIQVNATVAAGLADGTLITVPVEVRSTSFSQAVQAERTVTVNNNPALAAKLSASADPVAPGDSLGFSVDLGNAGTAAVTGIDYRLLLPRHVTFVNANNGGVYDAASRTVNWPVGSLAAGAHVLRTATVTVDTATPAGSILTAHGELRHDGGAELDASQAQAVAVLAAVPMQLQLTASPDPVSAGGRLLTDIVVTNTTASPLAAVRVVLRVPGGLSFSYFNDAEPDSSACSANVCDLGEEPTWNLGTLAAGASATIQVNATVAAGLADGTLITVPVEVRSTSFSQAVQAERTVTVNNNPALAAKLSASADPVAPGDSLGFSVDLGNAGTAAVTGIGYRLLLPRHVTFVNANNGGVYDAASRTVNWPVGSLAAGAHVLRTATVTVDTATPAGSILTAHGELRHDGGAELDASQAQAVAVLAAVPMQLQLTASPDPVSAGGRLLTDIVVTNTTASPLAAVRVVLRVPGGLSFSYFNDAEPDSSACSANVCDLGEEPTWNLGTLAAGASATIQVNATVAAGLADGTLITVPVEVRSTSFSQAVQAERTVTVNNNPALAAKLSASADPVAPGDSLGFSVDLGNAGTAAVTGIGYRLLLPRHVTFVNANNGGVYDAASRTVNWPVGSLAAGAHVLRTATVTVDTATPAGSILTAHGELRHDGGAELDASQAQAVAVLAAVPMQLQLTASPDPVSAGGRLLTDIVVTNTTASPLAAVRVVLRVPGGLSFSYFNDAEPDSSACSANVCDLGEEPTWNLGTLAAGASATIQVNATVAAGLADGTLITVPVEVRSTSFSQAVQKEQTVAIGTTP